MKIVAYHGEHWYGTMSVSISNTEEENRDWDEMLIFDSVEGLVKWFIGTNYIRKVLLKDDTLPVIGFELIEKTLRHEFDHGTLSFYDAAVDIQVDVTNEQAVFVVTNQGGGNYPRTFYSIYYERGSGPIIPGTGIDRLTRLLFDPRMIPKVHSITVREDNEYSLGGPNMLDWNVMEEAMKTGQWDDVPHITLTSNDNFDSIDPDNILKYVCRRNTVGNASFVLGYNHAGYVHNDSMEGVQLRVLHSWLKYAWRMSMEQLESFQMEGCTDDTRRIWPHYGLAISRLRLYGVVRDSDVEDVEDFEDAEDAEDAEDFGGFRQNRISAAEYVDEEDEPTPDEDVPDEDDEEASVSDSDSDEGFVNTHCRVEDVHGQYNETHDERIDLLRIFKDYVRLRSMIAVHQRGCVELRRMESSLVDQALKTELRAADAFIKTLEAAVDTLQETYARYRQELFETGQIAVPYGVFRDTLPLQMPDWDLLPLS